jgi:proteic killer suppression protein
MIKSFKNQLAETIFNGDPLSRKQAKEFPQALYEKAFLALAKVQNASALEDFYFPPSNRFHALQGARSGEYTIDVKNKTPWRVVFKWDGQDAYDVTVENYH